jgi:hypothetical protein
MLRNADTVVSILTVQLNDNSTLRPFMVFTLAVGDVVAYDALSGWRVMDASGKLKTLSSGDWLVNSDGSVYLSGRSARATINTITWGATITPDLAVANNFECTLGGATTLANPSNISLAKSQTGYFSFKQDGSGGRTLALGAQYIKVGGNSITLTTAANALDIIPYTIISSSVILLGNPMLDCK